MTERSWAALVRLVHERADLCCEYCHACQEIMGQAMHVEHIDPAGGDTLDNLCLACANCNLSKAQATTAVDPETNAEVTLFHPRKDRWNDHFMWDESNLFILGKTSTGRATVARLKMNMDRIVRARALWIIAGVHPPEQPG